ncbi:MAG TPA: hypothetical protein VK815_09530 [Candidatus Acidoferrales bacterium]|jgi:hypothetical protein|nr:hypothetical protein [Candidatus Acidoferrales bacterium]
MLRIFPVLALIVCTSGCCVGLATKVRNETGKDVLVTVVDPTGHRTSTAVPAGMSRQCGSIINLGKDEHFSLVVSNEQSLFTFADASAIGRLPDAFMTRSRFTSDFPCLRITRYIKITDSMAIYAGGYAAGFASDTVSQPPGFPIRFSEEKKLK